MTLLRRIGVLLVALPLLAALPRSAAAQSGPRWAAQLSSTAYISQSELPVAGEDQTSVVQSFAAQTSGWWQGRLSAHLTGRLADDLRADREVYEPARMYTGYLRLRLDPRRTDLRLGRQFLHEGASWLSFDGLRVQTDLSPRMQFVGWAGAQSRLHLDFQYGDPTDRAALGARVAARLSRHVDASVGWAYTDRCDGVIRRPVDGELGLRKVGIGMLRARASYETVRSEMERLELLGRLQTSPRGPVLSLQYVDRQPQLETGSWFQRFSEYLGRVQIARETLRHRLANGFGGEVQALQSFTDEENSGQMGLALLAPHVKVGYARTYGDKAEGDRFYGHVDYRPTARVRLRAGAVASQWELLSQAPSPDERELVSSYVQCRFDWNDAVRIHAEVQTVDRPATAGDLRLLLGLDLRGQGALRQQEEE